jgi:hypothetical protein
MERKIFSKETGYVYSQVLRTAAILLIVLPFFLMQDNLVLAAIVALIGLGVFDATKGVRVNLNERTVALYTNVLGIYFGPWKRIPNDAALIISYIYRKEERKVKSLPENPVSLRDMEFYVHLADIHLKPQKKIYTCFEEQEAIDFAMFLGEELDVEVYDYYYADNTPRKLRGKGDPPRIPKD